MQNSLDYVKKGFSTFFSPPRCWKMGSMIEKFQADECLRADPTRRRMTWEGGRGQETWSTTLDSWCVEGQAYRSPKQLGKSVMLWGKV